MRQHIINAGLPDQASLLRKTAEDIRRAMTTIRKGRAGNAASRDITVNTEDVLVKLWEFTTLWCMTGRAHDLAQATVANLELAHDFFLTLAEDPSDESVPMFTGKRSFVGLRLWILTFRTRKERGGFPLVTWLGPMLLHLQLTLALASPLWVKILVLERKAEWFLLRCSWEDTLQDHRVEDLWH